MANEIDLVIGKEAFDEITRLITRLGDVDAKLLETATKFSNIGKIDPKNTSDLNNLNNQNEKFNKTIVDESNNLDNLNKKLNDNVKAINTKTKATLEEILVAREKHKTAVLEIKSTEDSSKAYVVAAGAYANLDAQYKKSLKTTQDLAASSKQNTEEYKKSLLATTDLSNQLKKIDSDVGKHTRNVGNYASSWNGLGNSINQITREAPAFANSVQTGFMALSNNLPILGDEISQVIAKNKVLASNGEKTSSVFSQVATSFFSWQTLLSIGVTLLTVYGAKLWELATAGDAASKNMKGLAEANAQGTKEAGKEIGQLDLLYRTANNVALSTEQRRKAVDKMQEVYPSYFKNLSDETIMNGEAKDAYYDLRDGILASARAKAISAKLDENAVGRFDKETAINTALEKSRKELIAVKKSTSDNYDIITGGGSVTGGGGTTTRVTKKDQLANIYKDIKRHNQNLANLASDALEQDSFFLKEQEKLDKKAAKVTYDRTHVKEEKIGKSSAVKVDKTAKDQAKIDEENAKNAFDRKISDLEKVTELDSDALNSFSGTLQERQMLSAKLAFDETAIVEARYQEELRLAERNADLIAIAENNKFKAIGDIRDENIKRVQGMYKEEEDAQAESLTEQLKKEEDHLKYLRKAQGEYEKEQADSAKRQADYLKSFADEFASKSGMSETFSMLSGDIEGFGTNTAVTFNAIAESAQEMFALMNEGSEAKFQAEYERLDKQKNAALEFAGTSEVAKAKIEEDFAKKKKEIEIKQFKEKQKIAIVNIAIDTAQAIMAVFAKTPPPIGIPLALFVGAMGAIQAGMVLSQKPPAYAEGTDNHAGGLMLVNDGSGSNFQEKVVLPSGKVIMPQGRNVLMDAPKGTKVLNHEQQLFEMLQNNNISMSEPKYQGMTSEEMDEVLGKHFSNIKTQNTIFDKNGFQSYVRNGNSITRSNSNRSQSIGISV